MTLSRSVTIAAALLLAFAFLFDPLQKQWGVDALWLAAVVVWIVAVWRVRAPRDRWHPRRAAPLVAFLVVFCAIWLPFFDNWRWAFTADSVAWFDVPYGAGRNGLHQSLLSVRGVDENFTYLHSVGPHLLMVLIEPTMFWHRVGKLLMSVAAIASIYLFFALTVGRAWAFAVIVAVTTNYVWIWYSYVSYGHVASYVFAYLSLAGAALIWRSPDDRLGWMACGLVGGLAFYFAQTAWAEVAAVGLALTVAALRRRRVDLLAIYGVTLAMVALPYALQWRDVVAMFARNAVGQGPVDAEYYWRIFREIAVLPLTSEQFDLGVHRGFLRPPLDRLYVVGAALAALGLHPRLRGWLRIPAVAPVVLVLLLFDAVLMTFTNNAYANVSTKRAYHIIPYYVFLGLLPFMVARLWARGRWPRGVVWALTAAALLAYGTANARLVLWPPRAMYGFTVFDGLIELRQRFPDQLVVLFTSRTPEFEYAVQGEESVVAREYRTTDTVVLERRIDAAGLADACEWHALLCYEPEFDEQAFNEMIAPLGSEIHRFDFYNSADLRCFAPLATCPTADAHNS